ncbi:hypothetical protein J5N97_006041 [Dioscorea zingiberensis]|uniref:RBR-type E3 ubiquitin transferase n=1 Tax=Dioscorea zingiberensis TaxID=325984 RepID=A0A9D5DBJ4_9LILI|nr:hypothetical protein J5N97_006041 [Dioscorea zingiberensis]
MDHRVGFAVVAEDLETLVPNQRRELLAAMDVESDLEFAYHLQLEEAMAASLSIQPSTSRNPKPPPSSDDDELYRAIALQTLELDRCEQEKKDTELCHAEMSRVKDDLRRCTHDKQVALEIEEMPDDEWDDYGNYYERPIEEGMQEEQPFRLYFKGMASQDIVRGVPVQHAAIGVAVCDPRDELVFKIQKPLSSGTCREMLEAKALIEGLNAVISLGIKRVNVFSDYKVLHNHVLGKWIVKQRKVANLINQILLLQRKLKSCEMFLLPRCHVRFVFQLVRDVIDAQIKRNIEQSSCKVPVETCNICLEDTDSSQMFAVDGCSHSFCFSCMRQHVEVKLLHGMLPGCPHEGCNIRLSVDSSRKFLSPRLLDIMTHRMKEASIPPTERVYCPYPECSALMSLSEAAICPQQESSSRQQLTDMSIRRKCVKCNGYFCIKCKVPWHDKMSCRDYKRLHPFPRAEDAKLQFLAREKLWRQCVKCSNMIELAEGCFHITCRCGYEFCYTCGAEWRDKKATCNCPLWDEGNIWFDNYESDEDSYFDEDEDDYDDDDEYGILF